MLESYPDDVIEYVTAPQTGIQRTQKFAPTIAEIAEACQARLAAIDKQKQLDEWAAKKRESDRLKAKAQRHAPAPRTVNLFVPEGYRNYEKMVARHQAEPDRGCMFETIVCHDGVTRPGIWVPLDWYEDPAGQPTREIKTDNLEPSTELLALLRRQDAEREEVTPE